MKSMLLLRPLGLAFGISTLALAQNPAANPNAVAGVETTQAPTDQLWSGIKDDTYDQRDHFSHGADRLLVRLDEQIRILKAKRATMTSDTKEWDFNMKEVDDSRVLLKGRLNDLAKADTPDVWADVKDKIGEAWRRSQAAVDKMNDTRTT
jgi:hypothetical protein